MAEESLSELVEKLTTFQEQLEQVDALVSADPSNEALSKLKEDLLVVINLTTDLVNIKRTEESESLATESYEATSHAPPPPTSEFENAAPPEDTSLLEDLELFNIGSIYETKYEGSWFPVYIESMTADGKYNVVFLGYRNTSVVPPNDLREIKVQERTIDPLDVVEGMQCMAKYAADGKYYPCIIKKQTEHGFTVKFTGLNEVQITTENAEEEVEGDVKRAQKFFIGVGTKPSQRAVDGVRIFDTDSFHNKEAKNVPRHMVVIGAGVLGLEYASMINILPGTTVTVIDNRTQILDFADKEMVAFLMHIMRENGARFLLGETVNSIKTTADSVLLTLGSGKSLYSDMVLYTPGRRANTDGLHLENIGVTTDAHGLIAVNDSYQTQKPHIYAGGDCIGFPALASTSNEQGRLASIHMWDQIEPRAVEDSQLATNVFPYGVYTVPEMSMVGRTEEELTKMHIKYEVGTANFNELAKAQMLGGNAGLLKLIFDPQSLEILGVHVVGEGAAEIVHIGQAAMAMKTTIEFFRDAVFNYPTLAEAYRVAALDGLGKVRLA